LSNMSREFVSATLHFACEQVCLSSSSAIIWCPCWWQDVLLVWGDHDQIFPLDKAFDVKRYYLPTTRLSFFLLLLLLLLLGKLYTNLIAMLNSWCNWRDRPEWPILHSWAFQALALPTLWMKAPCLHSLTNNWTMAVTATYRMILN
jgi:hypothetical protein